MRSYEEMIYILQRKIWQAWQLNSRRFLRNGWPPYIWTANGLTWKQKPAPAGLSKVAAALCFQASLRRKSLSSRGPAVQMYFSPPWEFSIICLKASAVPRRPPPLWVPKTWAFSAKRRYGIRSIRRRNLNTAPNKYCGTTCLIVFSDSTCHSDILQKIRAGSALHTDAGGFYYLGKYHKTAYCIFQILGESVESRDEHTFREL